METYRIQVIVEQDEDGVYVAEAPALAGCYSQGRTFEEALAHIEEAIGLCLREMIEDGERIDPSHPEVVGIKTLEIAV